MSTGRNGIILNDQGGNRMDVTEEVTATLRAEAHHPPCVMESAGFCTEHSAKARTIGYEEEKSPTLRAGTVPAAIALENHSADSRIKISEDGTVQTLTTRMGTSGNNVPLLLKIRSGCEGGGKGALIQEDKSATLSCNNDQTLFEPCSWDGGQISPTLTKQNAGGSQRMPDKDNFNCVLEAYGICSDKSNSMLSSNPHSGIYEADTARTIDANGGNPGCNQGGIAIVEGNGSRPSHHGDGYSESDVMYTLNTIERHGVAYAMTTGSYSQVEKEKSPTLMARDFKDPTAVAYGIGRDAMNQGKDARVSTDKDEQFTSYEAQVDYYTQFIKSHADWEFVKVYTDEGISGLGTRKRDGFNEMIQDALSGALDLIVTKSVSRFARNTVDSLVTIRKLKEKGVEVYFEKENIYSLDGKGELLLTIMSSLAQEESRSISENVTWGQRKRFSDGKVSLPYKQFLGYERGENKDDLPVVNPEQAVIVRRIYRTFMEGKTAGAIAKEFTAEGIPTPAGKSKWQASTINSILQNEKYRGSALLQKCFTTDFLTKKQKINEGEVPQYYIEHSHEAIIDPMEWDAVQEEIRRRKQIGRAYSGTSVFSAKLVCGDCGGWYGHKTWHSTDKYRTTVWRCNQKYSDGKCRCGTPAITEEEIKIKFLKVFNSIISSKKPYVSSCLIAKKAITDTTEIDTEMNNLLCEMEVVAGLTKKCIEENSTTAQNQEEYTARYNGYVDIYETLKTRYDGLAAERENKQKKAKAIDRFIHTVKSREGLLTEFDARLWLTTVEKVTITDDGKMLFRFFDGTEICG